MSKPLVLRTVVMPFDMAEEIKGAAGPCGSAHDLMIEMIRAGIAGLKDGSIKSRRLTVVD